MWLINDGETRRLGDLETRGLGDEGEGDDKDDWERGRKRFQKDAP
jgi:hypothetical protein